MRQKSGQNKFVSDNFILTYYHMTFSYIIQLLKKLYIFLAKKAKNSIDLAKIAMYYNNRKLNKTAKGVKRIENSFGAGRL